MKLSSYKIRFAAALLFFIFYILSVTGLFYPLKLMNIQFVPLFERTLIEFSVLSISILLLIVVLTFIFGRFYCSLLCPLGIAQEIVSFLRGNKPNLRQGNYGLKYLFCALVFGSMIGGSTLLIKYLDPYTIFSSVFALSIIGLISLVIVFVLVFFKNRFFCTNICPVGTVLGLISKFSVNKIFMSDNCVSCGMCENVCPSGCINKDEKVIDNETCVKCLKCLEVCPNNALKFGVKPVKFNFKRRDFLFGLGSLALLGAAYTVGVNFAKNAGNKLREIILPAGSKNSENILNKCLNCNLCVNNCPQGIIAKADSNFPSIHIDFTKGKGYCDFKCHKCSEVCPSGAIKKISLDEKQKTRIARAVVSDKCVGCRRCSFSCPTGAIQIVNRKSVIDESKCIGCGRCANICGYHAIEMIAITEQESV